jgi:hypothetical protein
MVSVRLLAVIALLALGRLASDGAGIILERNNPWDVNISSVEEFAVRVPPSNLDTGYKSYFRTSAGHRFGVDNSRIVKLIEFLDEANVPQIASEAELRQLIDEQNNLQQQASRYPVAKSILQRQLALISRRVDLYRAGYRKIAGKWMTPNEFDGYQREQQRIAVEAKAAEEKRQSEVHAAEERRLAEARVEEEKHARERAQQQRERQKREEMNRVVREKARAKKSVITSELMQWQSQLRNVTREAERLETDAAENYKSAQKKRITGQVFIATKGAQSYKFGAVIVSLFDNGAIQRIKASCDAFVQAIGRLSPEWTAADADEDSANGVSGEPTSILVLLPELKGLTLTSTYYKALPAPITTSETDADGRFTLDIPSSGTFVLAAFASRTVGLDTERYSWLVPLEDEGPEHQVLLSNNNVLPEIRLEDIVKAGVSKMPSR